MDDDCPSFEGGSGETLIRVLGFIESLGRLAMFAECEAVKFSPEGSGICFDSMGNQLFWLFLLVSQLPVLSRRSDFWGQIG